MPPADEETSGPPNDPRDREINELRQAVTELNQQLSLARRELSLAHGDLSLARRDTSETYDQLLVATARANEMEHHLHRRIIEVTELQQRLSETQRGRRSELRGNPVSRRFSPLLARTTLRLNRSEH